MSRFYGSLPLAKQLKLKERALGHISIRSSNVPTRKTLVLLTV